MSGDGAGSDGPDRKKRLTRLPDIEQQAGSIAWVPGSDPLRFVLVTSRRRGRWVFPKGRIERGQSPALAAEQEALEEAGIVGRAGPEPVGSFRGVKVRPPRSWTIEVTIYPLRIEEVLDHWPEAGERSRCFVTLAEARLLLSEPDMLAIAERFAGDGR